MLCSFFNWNNRVDNQCVFDTDLRKRFTILISRSSSILMVWMKFGNQISWLSQNKKTSLGWFFYFVLYCLVASEQLFNHPQGKQNCPNCGTNCTDCRDHCHFFLPDNQIKHKNESSGFHRSTIFYASKGFSMKSYVTLLRGFCCAISLLFSFIPNS